MQVLVEHYLRVISSHLFASLYISFSFHMFVHMCCIHLQVPRRRRGSQGPWLHRPVHVPVQNLRVVLQGSQISNKTQ